MVAGRGRGGGRGRGAGAGGGRGMGPGGSGMGPGGECVCPKCGFRTAHVRGVPCLKRECPQCGTLMVRGQ